MGKLRPRCTQRGNLGTYPLEEVLGRVLLMPVLAGFRSYARWPCSSPREKLGPVPVTTGAGEGDGSRDGGGRSPVAPWNQPSFGNGGAEGGDTHSETPGSAQ